LSQNVGKQISRKAASHLRTTDSRIRNRPLTQSPTNHFPSAIQFVSQKADGRLGWAVKFSARLKLRCEQDARQLNRPELTIIYHHLLSQHTTQFHSYRRTTTERPGYPVGHANILLLPSVLIYFNPILRS
jgi:hypothetical protein